MPSTVGRTVRHRDRTADQRGLFYLDEMARELVRSVDPIADSLGHLLVVSLPKSTSQLYPLAANIAEGATKHTTIEVDRKPVHLAAFGRSRDEAARALALMGYVSGWKTAQVFAGEGMPSPCTRRCSRVASAVSEGDHEPVFTLRAPPELASAIH